MTCAQTVLCRVLALALLARCSPTLAAPNAGNAVAEFGKRVQGAWVVQRTLVPKTVDRRKANIAIDDVSSTGRVYDFQAEQVTYKGVEIFCSLDASTAPLQVPVAALFAGGTHLIATRPAWLPPMRDDVRAYALGSLARGSATVFRFTCPNADSDSLQGRFSTLGHWIALTADTLLLPATNDGLRLLKRPQKIKTAAQKTFCRSARSANDAAVCEDAELWQMRALAKWLIPCAMGIAPDIKAELDAANTRRLACDGDHDCLYEALDTAITVASTRWPTPERCSGR